jgi:hypothetical protein
MGTPPAEPPPPPPVRPQAEEPSQAERRCPRCGAPHDEQQEYCLECGLRLVPLPGPYYRRELWSRESPVWLWLAALLIVALAGALAAVAASKDGKSGAANPIVTTGHRTTDTIGVITEPTTLTLSTLTNPTTTLPTITTIQPTTTFGTTTLPTTTAPTGTIISWPGGRDGYTVVLKSTPRSDGRGPAESAAQRAINAGLRDVGILDSSDYSSLRPGYYVTFSGVYNTLNEAQSALPRDRSAGFPLAYVRQVRD